MNPEMLKGFYRIGIFVFGSALILLFVLPPNSAEFVVSLLSLGIGATLLLLIVVVNWYFNR